MRRGWLDEICNFWDGVESNLNQDVFGIESKGADNEKDYTLYLGIPGFKKEDIEILGKDNELIVKGLQNKDRVFLEKGFYKKYVVSNRYDLNKIEASLSDGVLKLVVPLTKGRESIKIPIK